MTLVTRSAWGAQPPKATPLQLRRVDGWHIHWLGDAYPDELTDAQVLQSVQRYHQHTNKWNDIGYSFAIGRMHPEAVYEARGFNTVGAHTEGHNSTSLGIVFLVGEGEQPSTVQLATCARFIAAHHPTGYVRPHSAAKATACPGPDLRRWIAAGLTTKDKTVTDALPPDHPGARVQRACNANGVSPPLRVDGEVGPRTAAAVEAVLRHLNAKVANLARERDYLSELGKADAARLEAAMARENEAIGRSQALAAELASVRANQPAEQALARLRELVAEAAEIVGAQ
jgi:hypothetical protein